MVVKQFLNPNFIIQKVAQNDVALMKLNHHLNLSEPTLGSVCLPESNEPVDLFAETYAIATGWGREDFYGRIPNKLQKVALKIWKQEHCVQIYAKSITLPFNITDANMCIGQDKKSTCFGDSGGPLVHFNERTKRWTNYGVTSFGIACQINPEPAVDARVSTFVNWIWDTVAANSE